MLTYLVPCLWKEDYLGLTHNWCTHIFVQDLFYFHTLICMSLHIDVQLHIHTHISTPWSTYPCWYWGPLQEDHPCHLTWTLRRKSYKHTKLLPLSYEFYIEGWPTSQYLDLNPTSKAWYPLMMDWVMLLTVLLWHLSTVHTTVTCMPGPHSWEAPQFIGRKIKKFLYEFELQAKSAKLSDAQKCEYVVPYCKEKEAKFIQTLPGYESQQWDDLKDELLSYYPAEHEDWVYQIKDLWHFVQRDHKIRCWVDLNTYCRKFRVIMISFGSKELPQWDWKRWLLFQRPEA